MRVVLDLDWADALELLSFHADYADPTPLWACGSSGSVGTSEAEMIVRRKEQEKIQLRQKKKRRLNFFGYYFLWIYILTLQIYRHK